MASIKQMRIWNENLEKVRAFSRDNGRWPSTAPDDLKADATPEQIALHEFEKEIRTMVV